MEYFKLLHLTREPFSNSPDPAFFYESNQHKECIQKLEIALRLRRGLNVVTGEVGTGKTTLCRQLIQTFSGDSRISASLILDPDFTDPRSFLSAIIHMMTGRRPGPEDTIPDMKEHLKHYLFQKGVEEDRTVVLIVDEGQKMSPACLETLRELLNFETNEYKLLQIIIFAQNEFTDTLEELPNLADRINLYYRLAPLNFKDTRALIHHRLQHAVEPESPGRHLFSLPARWRIFRLSGGYPRKIIHLCHQCLLAMIIQNKTVVGWRIAGACARRTFRRPSFFRPVPVTIGLLFLAGMCFGAWHYSGIIQGTSLSGPNELAETDTPRHPPRTANTEKNRGSVGSEAGSNRDPPVSGNKHSHHGRANNNCFTFSCKAEAISGSHTRSSPVQGVAETKQPPGRSAYSPGADDRGHGRHLWWSDSKGIRRLHLPLSPGGTGCESGISESRPARRGAGTYLSGPFRRHDGQWTSNIEHRTSNIE